MHFFKFVSKVKWMAFAMSCFTMSFAPLAYGKEAEKLGRENIEKYLIEFGLNKTTTLGQFWDKSKYYFPGSIYKDLDHYVSENQNLAMPEITVSTLKNTEGGETPVLQFTLNGKTHTAQIYGEANKWVKFDGFVLTQKDLERPQDAFTRLEASNIKLKREAEQFKSNETQKQINQSKEQSLTQEKYNTDFARFNGFPRMTPQLWKSLSKTERAEFMVKMRLLWQNARQVLDSVGETPEAKKTSYIENLYRTFIEQDAFAAPPIQPVPVAPAQACIVAGYVGSYNTNIKNSNGDKRWACSAESAIAAYSSGTNPLAFIKQANDKCASDKGATFVACNPIIYGFPGGSPACIDKLSPAYQTATHFSSAGGGATCDTMSRLSTSADIVKLEGKDYSQIPARAQQIAAIEADQKKDDFALTKGYLSGVLAQKNPALKDAFEKGTWSPELDNELVRIQKQFEDEITKAIQTCESNITAKHEQNQKLACDQLHRRWLFTERFTAKLRDSACVKPATYIWNYADGESSLADSAKDKTDKNKHSIDDKGTALCQCPAVPAPPSATAAPATASSTGTATAAPVTTPVQPAKVNFGQSCPAPVTPAVVPPKKTDPPKPAPASTCDKPKDISGFDYDKCQCSDSKKLKQGKDGSYECEGSNWLPWVIGGVGIAVVLALLFRSNKSKAATNVPGVCTAPKTGVYPNCVCSNICAVSTTLNPTSCSCDPIILPPSCAAPMVGLPPSCACPVNPNCAAPQKRYDLSTCQCTDVPQPVTCPNGSMPIGGDPVNCPKCVNGNYEPVGGCPTEGGSGGNSCPQGGCNGGLPTNK